MCAPSLFLISTVILDGWNCTKQDFLLVFKTPSLTSGEGGVKNKGRRETQKERKRERV
jgi:hypothetical protein